MEETPNEQVQDTNQDGVQGDDASQVTPPTDVQDVSGSDDSTDAPRVDDDIPTKWTHKDAYWKRKQDELQKKHEQELAAAKAEVRKQSLEDPQVLKASNEAYEKKIVTMEIDQFAEKNPEFQPYADKIKKFAEHPDYSNVPIEQLAWAAAGKDVTSQQSDSQEQSEANSKAEGHRLPTGTTKFQSTKPKDYKNMTDDEIDAEISRVKSNRK